MTTTPKRGRRRGSPNKRQPASLAAARPELAAQWHPFKNGLLTPKDVTPTSKHCVHWKCPEGPDHEWKSSVQTEAAKQRNGCPFCIRTGGQKRVSYATSLVAVNPEVALQWHPTKNGDLTPADVFAKSTLKVHWKCPEGPDHEWEAQIYNRTINNNGCPYCCETAKKKVSVTNCLETLRPDLAELWHPTKNGDLTPADVTPGVKHLTWWQCHKDPAHEWKDGIYKLVQVKSDPCPFCADRRASATNNLTVTHPNLAELWHPTKNGLLTPDQIMATSTRQLHWKCPAGPDHEWITTPQSASAIETEPCPFCANRRLSVTNSLATINPDLAAQWHPTKNGDLTPDQVRFRQNIRIWWRCPYNPEHEWEARLDSRHTGVGCPTCVSTESREELAIRGELCERLGFSPDGGTVERHKGARSWMVDAIHIKGRVVVEFDGEYWHSRPGSRRTDTRKTKDLLASGWRVIRVRHNLKPLTVGETLIVSDVSDLESLAATVADFVEDLTGRQNQN